MDQLSEKPFQTKQQSTMSYQSRTVRMLGESKKQTKRKEKKRKKRKRKEKKEKKRKKRKRKKES